MIKKLWNWLRYTEVKADPDAVSIVPEWAEILADVADERLRQVRMWGVQRHLDLAPLTKTRAPAAERQVRSYNWDADNDGMTTWDGILLEEVYEAFNAPTPELMAKELVEVAAVAVAWVEDLRSRGE